MATCELTYLKPWVIQCFINGDPLGGIQHQHSAYEVFGTFRDMAKKFCDLKIEGKPLHSAIKYGLTQALLDAVAKSKILMPAEVICQEYNLPIIAKRVPIFGQSGDDRYHPLCKVDQVPYRKL